MDAYKSNPKENMKGWVTLLLMMGLLVSCSRGSGTQTRLEINLGALNGGSYYPGGLFLTIFNPETQQSHSFDLTTDYIVELPIGRWNFRVVGFQGPGTWQGASECGGSDNVELSGESATVVISVSAANCNQTAFAQMLASKGALPAGVWDSSKWGEAAWAP
jgi:hypothetical protein